MADSTLSLFSTLALASFDRFELGGRRTWIAAFAVALTGAILAKATAALLVVGLPIALWLLLDPPSRDGTLPDLARASLLALAGGFLWYGVVIATLPGALHDILTEAALPLGLQLDPAAQSARHYAWPHALVGPLVVGSLPAGVFIPLLVRRSVESRFYRAAPRLRFVGIAFISLFVAFALIPQKQRHYLLPLLPLLALLLAEAVLDVHRRAPGWLQKALIWISMFAIPLAVIALGVYAFFCVAFLGAPKAVLAGLLVGASVLLASLPWLAWRGRWRALAALSVACLLAVESAWYGSVNVWRLRFKTNAPLVSSEYSAERWERAGAAHPWIARLVGYAPGKHPPGHLETAR